MTISCYALARMSAFFRVFAKKVLLIDIIKITTLLRMVRKMPGRKMAPQEKEIKKRCY